MAEVVAVPCETKKEQCRLCGLQYDLSSGRKHGFLFKCHTCMSSERTLRRNLGDAADLQEWSREESEGFFRRLLEEKRKEPSGILRWSTVRATMLNQQVERALTRFSSECEVERLPLSVWLNRGWTEEVVRAQKKFFSDEYNCEVYEVPIQRLRWAQAWEREESRILQKEQEARQKKQTAKAAQEAKSQGQPVADLGVPLEETNAKKSDKAEKTEARKEAALQKKTEQANVRIGSIAAKALGPLTSSETGLAKTLDRVKAASVAEEIIPGGEKVLKDQRDWLQAARQALNAQERLRVNGEVAPLEPLPFTLEDVKLSVKQSAEMQKALKDALPKKAKKAAAPKAAADKPTSPAAKKRKTGKSPP